jgi:hypothetical protein
MIRPAIVFSVLCVGLAAAVLRADVATGIVEPYLKIQTALVGESLAEVKTEAAKIAKEAAGLGAEAKSIGAAAAELEGAVDLAVARAALGRLSDAIIKYAEKTGTSLGADVNVAYCSMEKKSWLQKGKKIQNPYGGKAMRSCGEIVKAPE